jgi:hypothetical protein
MHGNVRLAALQVAEPFASTEGRVERRAGTPTSA